MRIAFLGVILCSLPGLAVAQAVDALESQQRALLEQPLSQGGGADEDVPDRIMRYVDHNLVERAALLQQFHRGHRKWPADTDPHTLQLLAALEAFNHRALDQAVLAAHDGQPPLFRFRGLMIGAAARIQQGRLAEAGEALRQAAQLTLPEDTPAADTANALRAWAAMTPEVLADAAQEAGLPITRDVLRALKAAKERPASTTLRRPARLTGPCLLEGDGARPRLLLPASDRAQALRPLLAQAGIIIRTPEHARCAGRVLVHPLLDPGIVGQWIDERVEDLPEDSRLVIVTDRLHAAQRAILAEVAPPAAKRLTFTQADRDFIGALERNLGGARVVILVGDLAMTAQVAPLIRYLGRQPRIVTGYLDARDAALIRPEDLATVEHLCAGRDASAPCLHTPATFAHAFAKDLALLAARDDGTVQGQWGRYHIGERQIRLYPRWSGPRTQ
ncbi:MAG: hypothetical protein ACOC00_07385 [Halothiobacillaceae bacterium]